MAIGMPIDTEAGLRALMKMLIKRGYLNMMEEDEILQEAERAYALSPEKHYPQEGPQTPPE